MDLGAVLGLGARFRLTDNLQLGTSFRFDYSLGNMEDEDTILDPDRAPSHNATGGFMVDFTYHLGN